MSWFLLLALLLQFGQPTPIDDCISLVGDSVPHGEVVYSVPGHGFGILRAAPLSIPLQAALDEAQIPLTVRDRSAPAAFLSDLGKNPYTQTEAYTALLQDLCRFTVVTPWINDLSIQREDNLPAHITDLVAFAEQLKTANPNGKVILLGFYDGQPSDFARQHAAGYQTENLAIINELLAEACRPRQALGRLGVLCLPTAELFTLPDNAHVALAANRAEVEALLYEPIPADVLPFFEAYWRDNPDGLVYGDGVHLSEAGKAILVEMLVEALARLMP